MLLSLLLSLSALAASPDALRALQSGDCGRAVATAGTLDDDAERLAIGRCQVRLGQATAALGTLAPIEDTALTPYARLVRGEALVQVQRFDEALVALDGLSLPGAAGERVALLRGRALVMQERWTDARAVLNGLLQGDFAAPGHVPAPGGADPGEVRWWLAQGAILRGEPDKALPVLENIWSRNPSSHWADAAAAILAAHGRSLDAAHAPDLLAARAETFEKQRRYKEALELRDLLADDMSDAEEARLSFRAKDYPRAVAAFSDLSSPSPSQRFDLAVAATRSGDYARATDVYTALFSQVPGSKQADLASFKVGYLAYDAGDLATAIPRFREHLRRYPGSRYADETWWFIGWSLFKLGEGEAATEAWDNLLDRFGSSSLVPDAAYWTARVHELRGEHDAAVEGYADVLRRWPRSGAAWFADQRLARHQPGVQPDAPRPELPVDLQGDAWIHGRALARVGLLSWARDALAPLKTRVRGRGHDAELALALALVDAGDYTGAQKLARRYCAPPPSNADAWALRACYPLPAGDLVASIAVPAGLPAQLPAAIANAESALKPWVTSIAGARGLMQLMPDLAAAHHQRLFGDGAYDPDALYEPAYNSALGTTELVELLERYRDSGVQPPLPLVIAGYNAGTDAVDRWLSAYGLPPEGDRFAEDVGYTETRRYVRRVLGHLQTLRYVYGDG